MSVQLLDKVEKTSNLKLTARLHNDINSFLNSGKIFELVKALGSPLNILFPEMLEENLSGFYKMLQQHKLTGRIYFAHKANRADAIPRHLATTVAYIDVSSVNELRHALGCGFEASRIQATGPKNTEFLHLCLQHNIVIAADSLQELKQLIELKTLLPARSKTQLLLRVSGFKNRQAKHQGKASRFGIRAEKIHEALDLLETVRNEFRLLGFSFHLDTVSALEKSIAVESCLQLIEEAIERDLIRLWSTSVVDSKLITSKTDRIGANTHPQ
ncbi:MAG TPA: hypothetical protein V6C76_10180 [Drouetiella sp.]